METEKVRKPKYSIIIAAVIIAAIGIFAFIGTRPRLESVNVKYTGSNEIGTVIDSTDCFTVCEKYSDGSEVKIDDKKDLTVNRQVLNPGNNKVEISYKGERRFVDVYSPVLEGGIIKANGKGIYEAVKKKLDGQYEDFVEIGPYEKHGFDFAAGKFICRLGFYNMDTKKQDNVDIDSKPNTFILTVVNNSEKLSEKEFNSDVLFMKDMDQELKELLNNVVNGIWLDNIIHCNALDLVCDAVVNTKPVKQKDGTKEYSYGVRLPDESVIIVSLTKGKRSSLDLQFNDKTAAQGFNLPSIKDLEAAENAERYDNSSSSNTGDNSDSYSDSSDEYENNSGSSDEYDDWDTDDNGVADWHDVDTDNDGNVSSDEMEKYLDDWESESNDN